MASRRLLLGTVLALAATLVPALRWEAGRPWLLGAAGVLAVLLLPGVLVAPWLRYRTHRWEATGTAVYSRTGWLGRPGHRSRVNGPCSHPGLFGAAPLRHARRGVPRHLPLAIVSHWAAIRG